MKKEIQQCKYIRLYNHPVISIGSDYRSDIYYQMNNKVKQREATLYFDGDDFIVEGSDGCIRKVKYGQRFTIYTLYFIYLGSILLIFMNQRKGDYRINYVS